MPYVSRFSLQVVELPIQTKKKIKVFSLLVTYSDRMINHACSYNQGKVTQM